MNTRKLFLQMLTCSALVATLPAQAANECKVTYGWHEGAGTSRQDRTGVVQINAGQTVQVNRNNMNFLRNEGTNTINAALDNKTVTLAENQVDPPALYYLGQTTLRSLSCATGSAASFQTPEALVQALKAANVAAAQIASQLKSAFNRSNEQIAMLLQGAGYTANQIAAALKDGVNANINQVLSALRSAGYAAQQAAAAAKSAFNATAAQVASGLKAAGYTLEQVTAAVRAAFSLGLDATVAALRAANYTAAQIAAATRSAFNASAAQVAAALRAAGYAADQVAGSIKTAFNAANEQVAAALQSAGFTLAQIAGALRNTLNLSADAAAGVLASFAGNLQDSIDDIVAVLRSVYGLQNCGVAGCPLQQWRQVFIALRQRGADLAALAFALRTSLQANASAAVAFLMEVSANTTREAMQAALQAAGYTTVTIAAALDNAYGALQPLELTFAYHGQPANPNDCNFVSGNSRRYGPGLDPLPLPARVASTIAFYGKGMHTVTGLRGLPAGASATLVRQGACLYIARIDLSRSQAADGASGQGTMMGAGRESAAFRWVVGPDTPIRSGAPPTVITSRGVCTVAERSAGRC